MYHLIKGLKKDFVQPLYNMPKIEVYSAITNGKDNPRNDIKVFSDYNKFVSPVFNAKIYKILPHKYLDCDISVWVDGNMLLKVPKEQLVAECLGEADLAVFHHNHSARMEWEMKWIKYVWRSRDRKVYEEAKVQYEHYKALGVADTAKMAMCGMLIRRHTPVMARFNEAWWAEICRWGQRDQLSFPIVLSQFPEIKVNYITQNVKNNSYMYYEPHKQFTT